MEHEDMYFVVGHQAITLDEIGNPIICPILDNGAVDWDSFDLIDWMDLLPDQYQLYKACVDFLQQYSTHPMYIK